MPSILIDGYNLALREGTGVASYARDLCRAIQVTGLDLNLIYQVRSNASDHSIVAEIDLYDPLKENSGVRKLKKILQISNLIFPMSGREINKNNFVINKNISNAIPEHKKIFGIKNGFTSSHQNFDRFGRIGHVSIKEHTPNIAHWTYPLPLKLKDRPNIYTLHDLVPLIMPYTTGDKKRTYWKLIKWISEHSEHIVTVSEASKKDILKICNVPDDKITVTYQSAGHLGNDGVLNPKDVSNFIDSLFRVEYKKYFLFYGAIEPKKNVARLIDAYLQSGSNYPLLIVGKDGYRSDEELRWLDFFSRNNLGRYDFRAGRGRIIRVPYVPRKVLAMLASGARAVVFPSIYEGFGLPIVEAMQFGTAVITSSGGACEEIAGGGALLVDAFDTNAIANGMRTIEHDEARLTELEQSGIQRAKFFSFENYAQRISSLYKKFI